MKRVYRGFTLFETLLVLGIVFSFLLFPILFTEKWHQNMEIQQFFSKFEKNFLATQQAAIVLEQRTSIKIVKEKSIYVQFVSLYAEKQEQIDYQLEVPESIDIRGPSILYFTKKTGNPASTITKYSFQTENKCIIYQLQMGSGRFVKKIIQDKK